MITSHLECYRARDGWRWRVRCTRNGRIQAASAQAFNTRRDSRRAGEALLRSVGARDSFPIRLYTRDGDLESVEHYFEGNK